MRRFLLAFLFLLAAAPAAMAACTDDQLQAKSIQFADLVKAILAKDPSKTDEWRRRQAEVDALAQATTDIDQICSAYDKAIADAGAVQ